MAGCGLCGELWLHLLTCPFNAPLERARRPVVRGMPYDLSELCNPRRRAPTTATLVRYFPVFRVVRIFRDPAHFVTSTHSPASKPLQFGED